MHQAKQHAFSTVDKTRFVEAGDPEGAFLFARKGLKVTAKSIAGFSNAREFFYNVSEPVDELPPENPPVEPPAPEPVSESPVEEAQPDQPAESAPADPPRHKRRH